MDVNDGFGAGFKEGMDANVGLDWEIAESLHVDLDVNVNSGCGAGFKEGNLDDST